MDFYGAGNFFFFDQFILVSYRQRSPGISKQDILMIAGPQADPHDPGVCNF